MPRPKGSGAPLQDQIFKQPAVKTNSEKWPKELIKGMLRQNGIAHKKRGALPPLKTKPTLKGLFNHQ
jgi:hypothetical protein